MPDSSFHSYSASDDGARASTPHRRDPFNIIHSLGRQPVASSLFARQYFNKFFIYSVACQRPERKRPNRVDGWLFVYSFLFCLVSYSFLLLYFPTRLKERGENIYILDTFILFLLRYLWRFKVDTFYGTSQVPKSITQNISIRRD